MKKTSRTRATKKTSKMTGKGNWLIENWPILIMGGILVATVIYFAWLASPPPAPPYP